MRPVTPMQAIAPSPCKRKPYTTAQASTTQTTGGIVIMPVRHERHYYTDYRHGGRLLYVVTTNMEMYLVAIHG